jgi:hypothetical protein
LSFRRSDLLTPGPPARVVQQIDEAMRTAS